MYFKGDQFKYYYNNEPKTKEEIEQLIDYDTTVSIDNFCVNYFSPKKSKIQTDYEQYFGKLCGIAELLKEADEHQKQNGGILEGVEFPFDSVLTTEDRIKNFTLLNLKRTSDREQKVIEDWNRPTDSRDHIKVGEESNFTEEEKKMWNMMNPFLKVNDIGKKESEGKLSYELDWEFIQQMAERMSQNKGKYEPYNWKKLMDVEKLKQSLFRHTIEIMKGSYSDDGREMGHLESLADNAMMINYQLKNNQK